MKLRSEHLVKQYGAKRVVNDVSVEVNQGEIVGLLGPNGAGKTTSFYMFVGLVRPDEGKVFLEDTEISTWPMFKRAQNGVGYLPQEASVFRELSVEENIQAILEMTSLSKAEQADKLESLIAEFGLGRVRKNLGKVLSGGERRRTEIARALATDPKFILLDEPFAGVDPIAVLVSIACLYENMSILRSLSSFRTRTKFFIERPRRSTDQTKTFSNFRKLASRIIRFSSGRSSVSLVPLTFSL